MRLAKLAAIFAIILNTSCLLLAQSQPNTENGVKSFGSYTGSDIDTVNLQNGNVMVHIPLFSYPQRGGLGIGYSVQLNSKNWQVGQYYNSNILEYRWMLGGQAGLALTGSYAVTVQRGRTITTDLNGNVTEADFDYAVRTGDGAVHWLTGALANGNMVTLDGSNFQFTLTRGTNFDHSDDSGVLKDSKGNTYNYPSISNDYSKISPASGNSYNLVSHVAFTNTLIPPGNNTVQTFNDFGLPSTMVDTNGNTMNRGVSADPFTGTVSIAPVVDGNGNTINFSSGPGAGAVATANCPALSVASSAYAFSFPGPNGNVSPLTICNTGVTLAPAFSQPNVQAPKNDILFKSYPMGGQASAEGLATLIGGLIMPDGTKWAFAYDAYGNITTINLPTGGVITYEWTEIPLPACGDLTEVSRAVSTRKVNDLINPVQTWQYTWGTMQPDGTITNYVRDPNGNETAHVFKSPVANLPCALYEIETRSYQGTHGGTPLKTVDTHYMGVLDFNDDPTNSLSFASRVVADNITTTLPGSKVSQIVRQYDGYPANTTFGKVTNEKAYDYTGLLLRETATTYQWQVNAAYLNAGLLDLPASVIVKDGSGCKMAETDYAYEEPAYPNTNYESVVGTLPAGTHQAVSTPRGNLTTTTHMLFDHSQCTPAAQSAVSSHTTWYDTGEAYQHIDPLGHTTTVSYDLAYDGMLATQTCSPQTGGVNHCVSGTYDFLTGLLESFTGENATTQASGNTPGDSAHTSSYIYDASWRLKSGQAPPDPLNGGASAQTSFNYGAAYPFTIQKQKSITTAMSDVSTVYLDGVGRAYHSEHAVPGGPAKVDTAFDGLGQAVSVSNPYFSTSDATYGVTQPQYDGLGRTTQIKKQDGSFSSVDYSSGNCTVTTDEANNLRKACSDALGRLIEVDEPGDSFAGTYASGSATVAGTLVSQSGVGQTQATQAHGSVTLGSLTSTGGDLSIPDPNAPLCQPPHPCQKLWDTGWVQITVNGTAHRVNYGQTSTLSSIASALVSSITSGVTATESVSCGGGSCSAFISFTAVAGAAGNSISITVSSDSNDDADFGGSGFFFSSSSVAMSGGSDANLGVTVWDQGNVTATVDGYSVTVPYGQTTNGSGSTLATALAAALNVSASPVTATANGTTLTLNYKTTGGNGTIGITSVSTQTQWSFPANAFTSSGAMANGEAASGPGVTHNYFVTLYQYDALGNMLTVTQKGDPSVTSSSQWRVRNFTYDSLSRLLTATNPESGTIAYSYDNDGELLQKTSPAPNQTGTATQTVSYCYDALHRVTGKGYGAQSCPLAAPVVSYTYDVGANAIGKLISLADQAGTASYSYDVLGRLANETRVILGVSKSTGYTYNLDGSVKTLTYPSNRVVTYTLDSAGRLVSAVDGNGTNYVSSASYNAGGLLTGLLNGSTPALNQNFQYTPRLQLCRLTALTSGSLPTSCTDSQNIGNIMDRGYDFHTGNGTAGSGTDNGNVFTITNYRDASRSQAFTYDALNRLTSGWSAANTGAYSWGENYSIDAWGNLQISPTGTKAQGGTFALSGNVQNRPTGLAYDAAGNLMSYLSSTYIYDQESRLSSTSGMSYTYDGNGERVLKSNASTGAAVERYWFMGGNTLAEGDGSGNLTAEYIYFGGKRIARIDLPANTVHYYLSDHLSSTSIVVSAAGTVEEESDYYPFGTEVIVTGPGVNELKFNGKRRDAESGLYNFGARYNSSSFGRFMTPDWSTEPVSVPFADLSDPQTLNLYSYVRNNPLNRTDPTGHYEVNASGCSGKNAAKCQKKYDNTTDNFEKQRQKDLQSKDAKVRAGAAAFGAQGEKNGVHVGFADLSHAGPQGGAIKGSVDPYNSGEGKLIDVQVRIDINLKGNSLQETIAHEGTHVGDDINFLTSYNFASGKYDATAGTVLTHEFTEFRAYSAGAGVNREHGFGPHDVNKILDFVHNSPAYRDILYDPIFPNNTNYPQ